jgi:hypothetical protein
MGIRSQRNYVRVLRFFDLPRQSIMGAIENPKSRELHDFFVLSVT